MDIISGDKGSQSVCDYKLLYFTLNVCLAALGHGWAEIQLNMVDNVSSATVIWKAVSFLGKAQGLWLKLHIDY